MFKTELKSEANCPCASIYVDLYLVFTPISNTLHEFYFANNDQCSGGPPKVNPKLLLRNNIMLR